MLLKSCLTKKYGILPYRSIDPTQRGMSGSRMCNAYRLKEPIYISISDSTKMGEATPLPTKTCAINHSTKKDGLKPRSRWISQPPGAPKQKRGQLGPFCPSSA